MKFENKNLFCFKKEKRILSKYIKFFFKDNYPGNNTEYATYL